MLELHKYKKLHEYNKNIPYEGKIIISNDGVYLQKVYQSGQYQSTSDFLCENTITFWVSHWALKSNSCICDLGAL